ncbi:hypothetical protein QJS10_CPB17g01361 [Acorus calamus]|uniref:glutathione transferase n=1 Tax=Acorus calamus TaxID=4465 RepID=A0AAV9CQJ3_ACOCL|nr:hypothetical protein QJS10_CPB17g01361 [Acorus calamus]
MSQKYHHLNEFILGPNKGILAIMHVLSHDGYRVMCDLPLGDPCDNPESCRWTKFLKSRAITEHLCHAYPEKGPALLPSDKKALASVLTWKEVEAGQFNVQASKLAFELFYKAFLFGGTADEAVVAEHEERLAKVLDVYEVRLSKNKYLGGDEYSLADLNHLPCLHFLVGTPVKKIFDSRPHVSKWCTDALARPAWAKVVAMM